jgi:ribosomal protein L29
MEMHWCKRRGRNRLLIFAVGVGVSLWSGASFGADRDPPVDPHRGIREETLRVIALGTPDDLLRLREAFDKTEQEIARFQLEIPHEGKGHLSQLQKKLKDLKDQLAESQTLLQLLGATCGKRMTKRQLDLSTVKERDSLVVDQCNRSDDLKKSVIDLEKEIRSGRAEYLRALEEERKALARLLTVRREWLLAEYQTLSGCGSEDRRCVARKVKILCRLTPLFPSGSRAPILILLEEASSSLNFGTASTSSICEVLKHDFEP